ncbi:exosome complex component CSL4-like [Patiria miniata]|uniref:Exosome complex component CSL4 n=1 Tax=Patiria miniata TaxID=46514 RepID=A0A914A4N6_PATMI|nr:exosome complex component CSL4-like [Patiria miniata]
MAASTICIPGQRLGSTEEFQAGKGTYTRQGYVYSSLAGFRHESKQGEDLPELQVLLEDQQTVVPEVGSVVTVKMTSVNPRFCRCAILSVEGTPLTQSFRGMIRREDIRATEKDKVEVYKSYRPGDVVLARILSLGDAQWYLLSTAENELGVVLAQSEAGVNMVPISWCEMVCPKTHSKEFRKVARVQPQYLIQPAGT